MKTNLQQLCITLCLLLFEGVSSVWAEAGDFIDDASVITQNNVDFTPTEESGKKILAYSGTAGDPMFVFSFDGKKIKPGQIFGLIEYSANAANTNKCRFRKMTFNGNEYEEESAGAILSFTVDSKTIVICSFLQNANSTESKQFKQFYIDNVDEESFSLTSASVYVGVNNDGSTTTKISRCGVYTLGEILTLYPSLKDKNFQITDQYRLLNDACTAVASTITASNTNNETDNGVIETKKVSSDITTLNGCKLWLKSVDFSKLPNNYRYIHMRYLVPADGFTQEDMFEGLSQDAYVMLGFSNGAINRLPTLHAKCVDWDAKMASRTYVDGVDPNTVSAIQLKDKTDNWATYSRSLKKGYNSCCMPFKKFSSTDYLPEGISFYKATSLDGDKVTFTKLENTELTANNAFTNGTTWTPVVIKAEKEGVYTFVGRDAITTENALTGYKAQNVGSSSDVKFVGSFVNEVPSGDYASTTNYGITVDGKSFAKMKSDTKTTFFRAFLADNRTTSGAKAYVPAFVDDETTGIDNINNSNVERIKAEGIYTIDGRRVSNGSLTNAMLPKGIYIVNGKKVVIK